MAAPALRVRTLRRAPPVAAALLQLREWRAPNDIDDVVSRLAAAAAPSATSPGVRPCPNFTREEAFAYAHAMAMADRYPARAAEATVFVFERFLLGGQRTAGAGAAGPAPSRRAQRLVRTTLQGPLSRDFLRRVPLPLLLGFARLSRAAHRCIPEEGPGEVAAAAAAGGSPEGLARTDAQLQPGTLTPFEGTSSAANRPPVDMDRLQRHSEALHRSRFVAPADPPPELCRLTDGRVFAEALCEEIYQRLLERRHAATTPAVVDDLAILMAAYAQLPLHTHYRGVPQSFSLLFEEAWAVAALAHGPATAGPLAVRLVARHAPTFKSSELGARVSRRFLAPAALGEGRSEGLAEATLAARYPVLRNATLAHRARAANAFSVEFAFATNILRNPHLTLTWAQYRRLTAGIGAALRLWLRLTASGCRNPRIMNAVPRAPGGFLGGSATRLTPVSARRPLTPAEAAAFLGGLRLAGVDDGTLARRVLRASVGDGASAPRASEETLAHLRAAREAYTVTE